ncbi:uncharacterized protein BO72DRAFT_446557 [Aspergillus fijiensis CBS 313.89]|uniref:Uncharacterized protein n=1 Tax=Aspergillus fijiensis CBS 313.89 TaxID=1448319 RepID=A0A8G1VZX9_9EURO|nr:uncharacterized protein BO72DRAFT_446557 [Aspergillus fijiensis CBS 313.89]RAK79275.1 hypothetical protein BO72DRAFT_446557 [Aspergillus fijiensis CBS 313.89]
MMIPDSALTEASAAPPTTDHAPQQGRAKPTEDTPTQPPARPIPIPPPSQPSPPPFI